MDPYGEVKDDRLVMAHMMMTELLSIHKKHMAMKMRLNTPQHSTAFTQDYEERKIMALLGRGCVARARRTAARHYDIPIEEFLEYLQIYDLTEKLT